MDTVQTGQTLGPYRIIAQIGQGGMATVYKAYHAAMDRYVAIKILPRQLAESPEFMGRFQQEARTIANLEHAHILPVHDYGESDGFTYLVMRYLDAGTLKERIQAGELALAEVDRFFSQLTDALDYAHAHGVIHRDLKPSNVLVDARGNLFLTDFGVAKLLESNSQFTTTGGLIGTPAYMSPEQAQGQKVDQRSDIYSLGIILYEMITGRVPFAAETPLAVVLKHLNEPLPLPSDVKPGTSPAIERVILKALAKNPNDRFASVAEFLAAWKTALATSDTLSALAPAPALASRAASPSLSTGPAPSRRRTPIGWIIGGAGVLGIIVLALLGGLLIVALPLAGKPKPTANASTTATAPGQETVEPTQATGPVGSPGWTSWAAGNTIYTVVVNQDQILTGGPGSLTVWNAADGSVLRRFTSGNGLPDPTVTALFVDTDGTWWIGTNYGVAHFDGENWLAHYGTDDGLDSGNITSITRSGENLVVGTAYGPDGGGVNFFDGKQWSRAPNFPSDADGDPDALSNNVNIILADGPDELWVGTDNGLGYFDGENWTRLSTAEGLPSNRVVTLMFDQNDELWAGTEAGAAHFVDQTFEPTPEGTGPPYGVYGMLQDVRGAYWFSGGGGIWKFDLAEANWTAYTQDSGALPVYTTFGIAEDADGNLYFASDGAGLLRWDGGKFTPWGIPNIPTQSAFGRILSAPDGSLWFVQEYGSNTDRFDPSQETWSPVTDLPCSCNPLTFDSSGNLWAGEYNGGFWIVGKDDATHVTAAQGLPEEVQVTQIAFAQDGKPWIGTDHGVAFFDGKQITEMLNAKNTGFASDFVRSLFAASDGSMWVGLQGGLSHLKPDGAWEHFTVGNPFTGNFTDVYDLAEDASGALWVATYGDGVYRFADDEWQNFLPDNPGVQLPSPQVNSVTVAPDGSLWFGTYYSGAARFDGNEWSSFDVSDGLIEYNVNDIFVDSNGAIWFATSGGVTRYIP